MNKKKLIVTMIAALTVFALIGPAAYAVEEDSNTTAEHERANEHSPLSEEKLSEFVEAGLLTQEEADTILNDEAHLRDYVTREECEQAGLTPEHEGERNQENRLQRLVEDGIITQEQVDSILSGEAELLDFVDEANLSQGKDLEKGGMLNKLVEDGTITQQQADSITSGEAKFSDYVDMSQLPERGERQGQREGRSLKTGNK